jgi:2OG-Fe(II) oxygenase superfamily
MSNALSSKIFNILSDIQGSGSFQVSGQENFVPPGLQVKGTNEISFPLTEVQANILINIAQKAPFGKGSKTITDTKVRSAWEIDASHVTFSNPDWSGFMEHVLKQVKQGLGIEDRSVTANLYKLLVYEPGDFFLPHKDSEKEKGMFGTLVVGLPSTFSGGELLIRFDGVEKSIDFATAGNYKISFAAFYADCEHEIKPVTKGYRIALVYNLVQSAKNEKAIASPHFQGQGEALAQLLRSDEMSGLVEPFAVLLGHQYTPANFEKSALKLHDRPRAEALLAAAEAAGYFGILGLVTHYLSGELVQEYTPRRGRRYWEEEDEDDADGTMGEVYEETLHVTHWDKESDVPGLGDWDFEEAQVMTELSLGEGDPIEQESEGYTGNAGMTIDYWYHYGAVILWSKNKHEEILNRCNYAVQLDWLDYYLRQTGPAKTEAEKTAVSIMSNVLEAVVDETGNKRSIDDASPLGRALARFADQPSLVKKSVPGLTTLFTKISVEAWVELLNATKPDQLSTVFEEAGKREKLRTTNHLAAVLLAAYQSPNAKVREFALKQAENMPNYLGCLKQLISEVPDEPIYWAITREKNLDDEARILIERTIAFSILFNDHKKWVATATKAITDLLDHTYIHKVLTPPLLNNNVPDTTLVDMLRKQSIEYLKTTTAEQPQPPKDWRRSVPTSTTYKEIWAILKPFLESPVQSVLDYRQPQAYRDKMTSAISYTAVDLSMETIKKGSPHTLRLTKTQASYEKDLERWQKDVHLLEQLI